MARRRRTSEIRIRTNQRSAEHTGLGHRRAGVPASAAALEANFERNEPQNLGQGKQKFETKFGWVRNEILAGANRPGKDDRRQRKSKISPPCRCVL